ncbi:MAG TPA: hypothetical protein VFY65_08505, partial [Longimicrobium sp.]|nr:hypothetical protein [Longimicrobium sp.]
GQPARPPAPPMLEAATPRYPAAVVYILYREYLHRNPGLTGLGPDDPRYQRHMERRLRELYPTRGYDGMMRDAVAELRRSRAAWGRYQRELRAYDRGLAPADCETQMMMTAAVSPAACTPDPVEEEYDPYADPLVDASWEGQEEFAVPADSAIPTIPMEIDTLQLQGAEVDSIYYYESLATGTYRAPIQMAGAGAGPSIDDLIRAAGGEASGDEVAIQVSPEFLAGAFVSLGVIGWKAYRVKQATDRAIRKSEEAYPLLDPGDTKRDAMRHVFWSMMLRRYVGAFLAREITDYRERNSTGAPRVMDLHNNDIGRSYRYRRFRGSWLWDRWDWQKWGVRVRDYIHFSTDNAVFIPAWATSPPTTAQAWQREATVPDARYIYFRQ